MGGEEAAGVVRYANGFRDGIERRGQRCCERRVRHLQSQGTALRAGVIRGLRLHGQVHDDVNPAGTGGQRQARGMWRERQHCNGDRSGEVYGLQPARLTVADVVYHYCEFRRVHAGSANPGQQQGAFHP